MTASLLRKSGIIVPGQVFSNTVPYSHNQECTVEVSPVLVGSTVLFGASDGYLHAVDLNTGAYRGKRALGAPVFSSVAVSGNCLFVADFGGNIYNFKLHN